SATVTGENAASIISKRDFLASDPDPASPSASAAGLMPDTNTLHGDIAFINGLYQDLLGRAADMTGMAYWMNLMLMGESRAEVAQCVWDSPEHLGMEVDQLYLTLLHRPADPIGQTYWVNHLLGGMNEADVEAGILSSAEYQGEHPTDAAFVAGLYQDVLGRTA